MGENLEIKVSAPSHLHAGNIDLTGDLGRLYGTLGFTINYPYTALTAKRSNGIQVKGGDRDNAERYARHLIEILNISGGAEIIIESTIPRNIGLGSQTALSLAIGTALSKLYNINKISLEEMAFKLGRGTVTALGTHGFRVGGFIIDGGFRTDKKGEMIPPLIFRQNIPNDWYFVLCIPNDPMSKILNIKEKEDEVLDQLKPMEKEESAELARLVVMNIMPAIMEKDIIAFGKAITKFNSRLGVFWSDLQDNSLYCDPIVEKGIKLMLKKGAYCACQSCWGPTFYAIVKGEDQAKLLTKEISQYVSDVGGGEAFYSTPNNSGAQISFK